MADKEHLTAAQIVEALKATKGMVFLAADKLGVSDQTIRNYGRRYAAVREAIQSERGRLVDMAELKLWAAVQNGEQWAVQFSLRTLGKDRGFVERQEVTGADGKPFRVDLVWDTSGEETADDGSETTTAS